MGGNPLLPPPVHFFVLSRSRKYHLDGPAAMYVGVTFIVGVGAFYSQNNLLYVIFAAALSVMLVSGALGGAAMMGVEARRLPPPSATVGSPAAIRYRLTNRNRMLGAYSLEVEEDRAPRQRDPWQLHMSRPGGFAPRIGRRGSVIVEATALPQRRGEARLHAVRVGSRHPFGIVRKSVRCAQPGTILIRPRPIPPPAGALERAIGRRASRGGARRSRGVGAEPDFIALREYVPGDSKRMIAWRATARRDELVVRETAASAREAIWVVLCLAADAEETNERAISCAAGVILEAARRGLRVALAAPGLGYTRPPGSSGGAGNEHIATMLDDLARVELDALDPAAQAGWAGRVDGAVVCVRAAGAPLPTLDAGALVLSADEVAEMTPLQGAPPTPAAEEAA